MASTRIGPDRPFAFVLSTHGLSDALKALYRGKKLMFFLWILLLFILFLCSIAILVMLLSQYFLMQTTFQTEILYEPFLFPAVTICRKNPFKMSDILKNKEATALAQDEANEEYDESQYGRIPYRRIDLSEEESLSKALDFCQFLHKRRSVRGISSKSVSRTAIENCVRAAGAAPSGANQQPWFFAVVESADVKRSLREIVELEEELNYKRRMGAKWVEDLKPLRVNWVKPYIEEAPFVVAVFRLSHLLDENGNKQPVHYAEISCSIAAGFFLTAVHNAGLVTVTTTPLNCGPAIRALLDRPSNEKLLFLLPIGYPKDDATVPDISRKNMTEIIAYY